MDKTEANRELPLSELGTALRSPCAPHRADHVNPDPQRRKSMDMLLYVSPLP